jgi:transcriptional regulator with XRE-family HTH domain
VLGIKRVRHAKGLSLAEVAARTGLFREQVARAERDGVDVRASTLSVLAKALGVPVCQLFENSGHEAAKRRQRRRG